MQAWALGSVSFFLSVGRDPARAHEELEDDLAVVLVEADGVERLGRLPLLLLQVVGQQARLVAHVVRRRQLQVHAQLLLVQRQQLVPRQTGDGQELGKDDDAGRFRCGWGIYRLSHLLADLGWMN